MNFAEIQQKLNRLLQNWHNLFSNYFSIFYDPTPQVISIPYYDLDGSYIVVDVKNIAKIKEELENTFTSYFQARVLYVDPASGSDTNDGTETSPLRSLQAAVNQIPEGAWVEIRLKGDYILTSTDSLTIQKRNVIIKSFGTIRNLSPTKSGGAYSGYITLDNGRLILDNLNINLPVIWLQSSSEVSGMSRGLVKAMGESFVSVKNGNIVFEGGSNTDTSYGLTQCLVFSENSIISVILDSVSISVSPVNDNSGTITIPTIISRNVNLSPSNFRILTNNISITATGFTSSTTMNRILADRWVQLRYSISTGKTVVVNGTSTVILYSNVWDPASNDSDEGYVA